MAINTSSKRASCLMVGRPWCTALPEPAVGINQGDRQHVAYAYAGLNADAPPAFSGGLRLMLLGIG